MWKQHSLITKKKKKKSDLWPHVIQEKEENIDHKHCMIQKTVMQPGVPTGIRTKRKELPEIPISKKTKKLKLKLTKEFVYQFPGT